MVEISRITIRHHEGRLLTRRGERYPTSFVTECLTCGTRLRHASGCHNVYAPAYLEPDLAEHVTILENGGNLD